VKHDRLFVHRMRAAHVFLAVAALPVSPALGDAGAVVPFQVEFSTGQHCGTPEDFSAELLKRTQRVRPALGGERAFAFEIDVRDNEGTLEGRLTLREPGGRVTVRVVPGATCSEVIPALAVIAAVLVEPSASAEEQPMPAPSALPSARPEPTGWAVGASIGLVAQGAVAPQTRLGFAIEASATHEAGDFVSPLFAVAYARTEEGTARDPLVYTGTAKLNWWTVRASLCPVRWPESGPLALRPCGLFDLGALEAAGEETYQAGNTRVTWVAPGASARFDSAPLAWLDAAPFGSLVITAEAGIFRPLNRDRFVFDPDLEAFQPPSVGGFGRLAAGGRFQ
jgi:hypothetical protein